MSIRIVIITGPTGVGKTDLALSLAAKVPAEIINADIGSLYTPLTIGTAKPDWRNHSVPHHLFDIVDEPKNFTVVEFRNKVCSLVRDITTRGHLPIIVGGSGFYINALFYPPKSDGVAQKRDYQEDTRTLWNRLYEIDSKRAREIDKNDRYRIERALDIWYELGVLPSKFKPQFDPITDHQTQSGADVFFLTRELADLYEDINKRTHIMLDRGWIEEVKKLSPAWHEFLLKKKIIGYDDIIRYIRGEIGLKSELIAIIQKKTRNYAKRQLTFNRMLTKKFEEHLDGVYTEWINMSSVDIHRQALMLEKKLREQENVSH